MEPLFEIRKTVTLEQYTRTLRMLSLHSLKERWRTPAILVIVVIALLSATNGWARGLTWGGIYVGILAVTVAVLLLIVVPVQAKKRLAGSLTPEGTEVPMRFYADRVEWDGAQGGAGRAEYARLYDLCEDGASFYLLMDKARAVDVPKALCSPELTDFLRTCRSRQSAPQTETEAAPQAEAGPRPEGEAPEESMEGLVFETQVTYDFSQHQRLTRAIRRSQRKAQLATYAVGLVLVLLITGLWRGWVFGAVCAGMYAVILGLSRLIEEKFTLPRAEKSAFEANAGLKNGVLRTRFYEDRMEVTSPVGRVSAAYSKVRDVIETEENLYVLTRSDGAALLDKGALTQEQIAFVRGLKPVKPR